MKLLRPTHPAVSTNMVRLRGRAPSGIRVIGAVPLGTWKTITFVAALRHNKMTAPMVVEGAMNGEMFLAYVEQCLVPLLLQRNDIVVMDNVGSTWLPVFERRSRHRRPATCRSTRRTSIQSWEMSTANSRHSCAKRLRERFRPSIEQSARLFHRSVLKNVPTISAMRAMLQYDRIRFRAAETPGEPIKSTNGRGLRALKITGLHQSKANTIPAIPNPNPADGRGHRLRNVLTWSIALPGLRLRPQLCY